MKRTSILFIIFLSGIITKGLAQQQLENLDRGLVAVKYGDAHVFLSWRLLKNEPVTTGFNIYRQQKGGQKIKLNSTALTTGTNYTDSTADLSADNTWFVSTAANTFTAKGAAAVILSKAAPQQYFSLPIQPPPGGEIDGETFTYTANDASVADLDGDGAYEIILKWEPTNARNPPQTGFTGNQIIDAYKLNGQRLWRIDLGRNIRSGAAYTQFLAYDFDGDGKAEMITKTADGVIDGRGKIIGDSSKDWRTYNKQSGCYGKIVNGPEYLTVFDGQSGAALATVNYIPGRYPLNGWGGTGGNGGNDSTGGRADRFTAGVAYLDGKHPSAFFVRGWYGRTVIAAWDWDGHILKSRWTFDSKDGNNPYSGMANHSVSVADVDDDGKDEICVGAMTVDDNGKGLYTTGLGHGDALHVTKMHPDINAVQVFGIHEIEDTLKTPPRPGVALFDGKTGKVLFSLGRNVDVGRGVAADLDPRYPGFENWGGPGGLRDLNGSTISNTVPTSANFVIWWDEDLTRELLDKNRIDKWDWAEDRTINLLTAKDCVANNGSKATPCLSADLFGDWREEVIWRTKDNRELRIYNTVIPTPYRFVTLMQNAQYRTAIAGQNVGYNQPPHPGYYLGAGMHTATERPDSSTRRKLIFREDFRHELDTALWRVELEPSPGSGVTVKDQQLILQTGAGVTVWLKKKLQGDILITYKRKVVVNGGPFDRLSDLNQFFMAGEINGGALAVRSGQLDTYNNMQLYYVGMGGNSNTTTRFRKYKGSGERMLLGEYTDVPHLLAANKTYQVKIMVRKGMVSYWVDDLLYFSYKDEQPLRQGFFGFRSTKSHQEISELKIYQIPIHRITLHP